MAATSIADFLKALSDSQLLEPAQVEGLRKDPLAKGDDPKPLAKEVMKRHGLTPFQINQLIQGHSKGLNLGPYRLLDRIGEGGMGQVYKAHHQSLNRVVALKVMRKDKLVKPESVRRFYREIEMAGKLTHPNIVLAYDAGQVDSIHYFAMEYVEGTDLSKMVKQSGPLPIAQACEFIRQAALGLQHAHESGMVHRDIKPANLLVSCPTNSGKSGALKPSVKILDMGLARIQEGGNQETSLTRIGMVLGTPDYLSPEQAMNSHTVDIRADLYSLGCTFYYLLTAKTPFHGSSSVMELLLKHRSEEPKPIQELRPEVPVEVRKVVSKLMAKNPEDRYQTPVELAETLKPLCAGNIGSQASARGAAAVLPANDAKGAASSTGTGKQPAKTPRKKRLLVKVAVAAAIFVLTGLAALGYTLSPLAKSGSANDPAANKADSLHLATQANEKPAADVGTIADQKLDPKPVAKAQPPAEDCCPDPKTGLKAKPPVAKQQNPNSKPWWNGNKKPGAQPVTGNQIPVPQPVTGNQIPVPVAQPQPIPVPKAEPITVVQPAPVVKGEPVAVVTPKPLPITVEEPTPTDQPQPVPVPVTKTEPMPEPKPVAKVEPMPMDQPKLEPRPDMKPEPKPFLGKRPDGGDKPIPGMQNKNGQNGDGQNGNGQPMAKIDPMKDRPGKPEGMADFEKKFRAGQSNIAQGKFTDAVAALQDASELAPDDRTKEMTLKTLEFSKKMESALKAANSGNYMEAGNILHDAVEKAPNEHFKKMAYVAKKYSYNMDRGKKAWGSGNLYDARHALQDALNEIPNDPAALKGLQDVKQAIERNEGNRPKWPKPQGDFKPPVRKFGG